MNHRRFFFTGLAALVGVAALLALRAGGQVPADTAKGPPTIVEVGPDNIERTTDGKILSVTTVEANAAAQVPYVTADGRTFYVQPGYGARYPASDTPHAPDAESQKLMSQERAAAQEARALATNIQVAAPGSDPAELKKHLREKLAQIFDLQQERRTREIAKIEERLGKLKETLKKRDSAKDSIVDRRLETLTGGVDELGWEESFPNPAIPQYAPNTVPRPAEPRFAPTSPYPVPPAKPAPAAPPVAPVPAALPDPAARR